LYNVQDFTGDGYVIPEVGKLVELVELVELIGKVGSGPLEFGFCPVNSPDGTRPISFFLIPLGE
jgi:hypothetical protein